MAGLQNGAPTPQDITVHSQSRVLEVSFSDGAQFRIPFELMRVYSPSAEVAGPRAGAGGAADRQARRGPWPGWSRWATMRCSPAFQMATTAGIFSWDYLYFLGSQQDELWANTTAKWLAAGVDRDAPMPAKGGGACGTIEGVKLF
jgi:DUF971 family protein